MSRKMETVTSTTSKDPDSCFASCTHHPGPFPHPGMVLLPFYHVCVQFHCPCAHLSSGGESGEDAGTVDDFGRACLPATVWPGVFQKEFLDNTYNHKKKGPEDLQELLTVKQHLQDCLSTCVHCVRC